MQFKDNRTITLQFSCLNGDREFKQSIALNFKASGFYVKQVSYKNPSTGVLVTDVLYVRNDTGELDEKKNYSSLTHTATPIVSYNPPEANVYTLYTSIINEKIASFKDGSELTPNTFYKLTDSVADTYTFRIDDQTSAPSTAAGGILQLTLEFVKF